MKDEKKLLQDDGKTPCLEFELERPVQAPGDIEKQVAHVKAPIVALVPVPALLIGEVTVDFQMEVTDASTSKSAENANLSTGATGKWFGLGAGVQGKVETSRETTRSTDQTAKYQIYKSASQQSQTEGLSKLMDIMESCIEPLDTKE